MMHITQLTENIKGYITSQINIMSKDSPMICFIKPFITRAIDKNFSKITKTLDMIADELGNIDIENILEEIMLNIINSNPFIFKVSFIGDIEIGGGQIKFNLPLTDKRLVLNIEDLLTFKDALIKK